MSKELPSALTPELLHGLADSMQAPFYFYDEAGIEGAAEDLNSAYSWVADFGGRHRNYYAVKALPGPFALRAVSRHGMGADATSVQELEFANDVGLAGSDIIVTANNPPLEVYWRALELGATLNLDDISQLDKVAEVTGGSIPDLISFRWNPGDLKQNGVNAIIGTPREAKFGVPDYEFSKAYLRARSLGATAFGMHTMLASNELDPKVHIETARLAFERAHRLSIDLDQDLEFINLGGGLGIPYLPDEKAIDYSELAAGIQQAYFDELAVKGHGPIDIFTENGRHVTGPHGYLVAQVNSIKDGYHRFVGLNAGIVDLPRPGAYDSYHHATVLDASGRSMIPQALVGSLCEDNDYLTGKITKFRLMPELKLGDIVVMHDAGAHCRPMGFNYNGQVRPAELVLRADGSVDMIRRRETLEDLNATLLPVPKKILS